MARLALEKKIDLVDFKPHWYDETKSLTATLVLHVKVTEEESVAMLGEDLAEIAFASLRVETSEDGGNSFAFGYDSQKPRATCETHNLKLAKCTLKGVQPQVTRIAPVKSEAAVIVSISVDIDIKDQAEMVGKLVAAYGQTVDCKMDAVQGELPLDGDNKVVGIRKKGTGNWGSAVPVKQG